MDLYTELQQKTSQLMLSLKQLRVTGTEYADKERAYKIALRTEALKLRDEKMPVTLIDKVVYGVPSIAEARFQRDVALTIHEANKESINVLKLQMRLIEEQLKREWSTPIPD